MTSSFRSFVRKETLHILRDPRTMAIVLLIPVILMILFGFAISTEVNNIRVAAVAPVQNDYVRGVMTRLNENPYTTFEGYITPGEADAILRRSEADAVLIFHPENTETPDIGLVMDASQTSTVQAATACLQGIIAGGPGGTPVNIRTLYNPQMKSSYNFVPGIMGMLFMLICAMMTSVSIVREKETGTMEVLLVSPVRPLRIVLAKLVPYFVLSCLVLATILVIAYGLLDLPYSLTVIHVVWVSLLYIALSLALGILVSTLTEKQAVALIISAMLFMLPVIMLSGMLFPVENMPRILQGISCIVPARWYIDAMRKLMIEELPLTGVLKDVGIMLGMAVTITLAAVRNFNDKLE